MPARTVMDLARLRIQPLHELVVRRLISTEQIHRGLAQERVVLYQVLIVIVVPVRPDEDELSRALDMRWAARKVLRDVIVDLPPAQRGGEYQAQGCSGCDPPAQRRVALRT